MTTTKKKPGKTTKSTARNVKRAAEGHADELAKPTKSSKAKAKSSSKKKPEPNRTTPVMVGIRMSKTHAEKLRRLAKADDRSLVSYMGRLIEKHLAEQGK